MVYNNRRKELVKQTHKTLEENTLHYNKLFVEEDRIGNESNYIKIRNRLIDKIDFDWDYMVYCDDDLFFTKDWLTKMKKVFEDNEDVGILSAVNWHSQKRIEDRGDMLITNIVVSGGCLMFSKKSWQDCGPFTEGSTKTYDICKKATDSGWKIGFLKDESIVVHCGLTSILNSKGRAKETLSKMKLLCDSVGAITN